jgi:tetrahedral aminopeptidase
MQINIKLLSKICKTPGVPGFEQRIRKVVLDEISEYVDKVEVDNLGNVYAIKNGDDDSKRVMVAAHMDEIGFIVNYIDDNGFIKFQPLGGFDPKTLTSQRVTIHGTEDIIGVMGSKPIHIMRDEEKGKAVKIEDFYIDTGLSAEEVKRIVSIGDTITRKSKLIEMGNCINAKSLDNRISVYILIETLKLLKDKEVPYTIYGVFSVQEEIGIRGANVASHNINPHFGFGLDTTIAFDLPGAKPEESVTKLGKGVGIKILDGSVVCDYRMVDYMKKTANQNDINWQAELLPKGGTDTAGIQRMSKTGAIVGAVSIPTRHIHQTIEMVHKDDVINGIKLLQKCLTNLDKHNWER